MSSRKRITTALVGLILLVVVGWFVRELAGVGEPESGWSIGHHEVAVESTLSRFPPGTALH